MYKEPEPPPSDESISDVLGGLPDILGTTITIVILVSVIMVIFTIFAGRDS